MENILKHNFHDNIIKNVHINSVVDFMDEIVIFFTDNSNEYSLQCTGCVHCEISGNGWIIGLDTIREWCITTESSLNYTLPDFIPDRIKKDMKYLRFNLNTSNSVIEIVARNIKLIHNN